MQLRLIIVKLYREPFVERSPVDSKAARTRCEERSDRPDSPSRPYFRLVQDPTPDEIVERLRSRSVEVLLKLRPLCQKLPEHLLRLVLGIGQTETKSLERFHKKTIDR